jgi:hypothetical protein
MPRRFLTNHALVLSVVAKDRKARPRQISVTVGITDRAVRKINADLELAEYIPLQPSHGDKAEEWYSPPAGISTLLMIPIQSDRKSNYKASKPPPKAARSLVPILQFDKMVLHSTPTLSASLPERQHSYRNFEL